MKLFHLCLAASCFSTTILLPSRLEAAAIVPSTLSNTLATGDDVSSGLTAIGFGGSSGLNLFGSSYTGLYVNTNGNVTFGSALSGFVVNGLQAGVGRPILAPFFADVDTRGAGAITYGNLSVNGRSAFLVNWTGVGYFSRGTDKTNTFQLVLLDRSDTGAGNFDFQFNYGQIQWESGTANGGSGGLGGVSAAAGYSSGQTLYYELSGSLNNGAFLDGGSRALAANSLGSSGVAGRYDFEVRGGRVSAAAAVPEPATYGLAGAALVLLFVGVRNWSRTTSD